MQAGMGAAVGAVDAALQPPRVITSPGPEYGSDTRVFQGIPGLERASNGRLWATWYGGGPDEGPDNYVMLATSGGDGKSWSGVRLVVDPEGPIRAFDPCLWIDPRGRLWLFWAQAHSWWDGRAGVWAIRTDDPSRENPTWTRPRRLCHGIMMNKPTVLANGEWLLPVSVWDVPTTRVTEPAARHDLGPEIGANVVVSADGGETWTRRGGVRVPERTFDEHMLVERRDGSLWMLVRTRYGIGHSTSADGGRTWSRGGPSGIPHINARFFIRRLRSGRLLLIRHNPPEGSKQRSHLAAFLSDDDGESWKGGLLLDERPGVSYPDGVQAPDGTLSVIYDYSRKGAKQILLATFTEEDVLNGCGVSPRFQQRVVVNQATGGK